MLLLVFGLSAYAYKKQQDYKNVQQPTVQNVVSKYTTLINSSVEKFDKELEFGKKVEILKNLVSKESEIISQKKSDLDKLYTDSVKKMKEDTVELVNNTLKDNTLSFQDRQDSQKLSNAQKNLEELKKVIETEKNNIYSNENDSATILAEIEALLANYNATAAANAQQQQVAQSQQTTEQQTTQGSNQQTPPVLSPSQPASRGGNITTPGTAQNNTENNTTPSNNSNAAGQQ